MTPSRRLRVLSLSTAWPHPGQPSHGVFVQARLEACAALADVTVIAPIAWQRAGLGRLPEERAGGLSVHRPRYWYLPGILKGSDGAALATSVRRTVRRLHAAEPFDLIDAHFAWPEGWAAVRLGAELDVPVVVTLRGTFEWLASDPARGPRMTEAVRRAARVIGVSHPLVERAVEMGVAADRAHVIPNGVDLERFKNNDAGAARSALGLPTAAKLVVSVGHLSPRKGFQDLIAVLPELRASQGDVQLVIVGGPGAEGDNQRELEQLARRQRVAPFVHMLGDLSREEVARALGAADVFALASRYEGCPNVVLEALASGCPVVASAVGEVPHLLQPDGGLVYGAPEDRVGLTNALRQALSRHWEPTAVRATVADRSWGQTAAHVLDIWSRALQDAGPARRGA